ncbi:MAG TPA: sugar phosphate isomerase/epimerase [Lacipirellulaceae bacterium]|nr:sugar phosphate isomerase/epimerase [Lacipirellulaceae bacterium]
MLVGNPMIFRRQPIESALARCVQAGFDALELWPPQIVEFSTPALRRELGDYIRGLGMQVLRLNCADRPYFQMIESEADARCATEGLIADIDVAADLGMSQLLTWEGRAGDYSPQVKFGSVLESVATALGEACRYGSARNVELTVEVHPFTLGMDLPWLIALCDRLKEHRFSVTYDCAHFAVGKPHEYVQAIDQLGGRIGHVHFCDSDATTSELHLPPGKGCLDLDEIVRALRRVDFRGTMMVDLWLYPLPDHGVETAVPYVREVCRTLALE